MSTVFDLTAADAAELTALYGDYEWWADRDTETVREALNGTDVAVGLESNGELVAAARVLTDHSYYAHVYDVIVAADRRGEGFGRELLDGVLAHPELRSVEDLSLLCREGLVPFYESVGFELDDPEVEAPGGGTEELLRMSYGGN